MRVVAWNIRAGGGVRAERIAAALLAWAPDVVVLSEFRGTPPSGTIAAALGAAGLGHQRASVCRARPVTNALLVASRWRLRRLPTPFAADEPERWLPVRVEGPLPLRLGALHIPCRVSGRKSAVHDAVVGVARCWRRHPALLVGDTNSGLPEIDEEVPCFGPAERRFFAGLEGWGYSDAFRAVAPETRAYTWYSPNGGNGFRLDQGFVSPALRGALRDARYCWAGGRDRGLSDHAALLLDFETSASGGRRDVLAPSTLL